MKAKVVLLLLGICMISGCYVGGRLYPVQGPLTSQTPPPVYVAKLTAPPGLNFSVVLANGETFTGKMKSIAGPPVNPAALKTATAIPPQPSLAFAWDTIYGHGYYLAHVLGIQLGQAVLTGNQGTVIQVEVANARGVAVDDKGNVYKIVW